MVLKTGGFRKTTGNLQYAIFAAREIDR
jgi:hypothetical protein